MNTPTNPETPEPESPERRGIKTISAVVVLGALAMMGCASTTPEEKAKRQFENEMLERGARSVLNSDHQLGGCSPTKKCQRSFIDA